jgi:hypothetical protein
MKRNVSKSRHMENLIKKAFSNLEKISKIIKLSSYESLSNVENLSLISSIAMDFELSISDICDYLDAYSQSVTNIICKEILTTGLESLIDLCIGAFQDEIFIYTQKRHDVKAFKAALITKSENVAARLHYFYGDFLNVESEFSGSIALNFGYDLLFSIDNKELIAGARPQKKRNE